ncbi:unannotated protein [freshwater metagenome]|uniref:Unannotated protein n=1 Tax=freshwater metagenome TaxID=449393 RepID=A0A6J7IH05_9ZZZZ
MSTDPTDPTDPTPAPDGAEEPTAVHAAAPADDPPPGLSRSATDRMLFGVCGGIAERYALEPLLVRLAFVATLFIGGAGVLFYLAAALLIPGGRVGAPGPGRPGGPVAAAGGVLRALVALAVAIAAFTALCTVALLSFGTTAVLGAWPAALGLLLLGGLLVASARGRRATGALLVLALALAVPATAAVVADVDVDRSVGEREHRPGSVARAAQGYRLGAGQMVVDLRDLPLRRGERVTIPARVDVGQVGVVLPRDRCVAWTIRTDLGAAGGYDVLGASSGGGSWTGNDAGPVIEVDPASGRGDDRPRVTLDLRVGVGHVAVAQSRGAIDGPGPMARGVVRRGDDLLRTSACRTTSPRRRG